jgi:EmrB/QacA subfamily drug resistance transporter
MIQKDRLQEITMSSESNIQPAQPWGLRSLPRRQITWTLIGVMLAMFLSSLDQTVVGTAMPRIIVDLGGFSKYMWVTTAYIITSAVTVPIVGKLTDMYGRKPFYLAGLIIFISASLACGLSNTMNQIIIFRGVQGIGAGIMMANAFTVIGDLFPPAERGKYQGYISGVFGLSSIIGPTIGGFLTDSISWHWVFFVNIPLGLLIIAIFIKYFPHLRPDNLKHKVDYLGLVILILTVVPLMLALSWGGVEYSWGSTQIIGLFCFSGLMLIVFFLVERRAAEPIIPLSLFKNSIISISNIVVFLTGIGMFGGIILIPLFFQGVLGSSATSSGNLLIPMMMGMITGGFVSGQLLSRAGGHYRLLGIIGIAIMSVGVFLLSRMSLNTSYSTVVTNTVLVGLGLGITMPVYTIAVQNAVPYSMLGVASSSVAFFRSVGGAVGLAILGSVMNNRFATELTSQIPASIKAIIPPDKLNDLVHNPQALISPEAQAQLKTILNQLGSQGSSIYDQLLHGLRQALTLAISEAFFIGFFIILGALVITFFLKEIPLRTQHDHKPTINRDQDKS